MTTFRIPIIENVFDFEIRVPLDDVTYLMRFRWNTRANAWYLDLSDVDGNLIVGGRKIVVDEFLLDQYLSRAVPQGVITAFDTTRRQIDPGSEDFGTRVLLYYLDVEGVSAAVADAEAAVLG